MSPISCPECGGLFPDVPGPTHRYMSSSAGCFAAFGEVLAREYSDLELMESHRYSVDAYAVQHPGEPSPQSIKSVGVHLVRLCLLFEHDLDMKRANDAMLSLNAIKNEFWWLSPPPTRGDVTVADLLSAKTSKEHKPLQQQWARSAWEAWTPHHETVRAWAARVDVT